MLKAVRLGIEAQSSWVLVVDNSDNLSVFGVHEASGGSALVQTESGKSMYSYIPTLGGTVLWTSRDERIVGTLVHSSRGIEVSRMTELEAIQLLSDAKREGISDLEEEEAAKILLEELQWLPLAVYQAGAYMRETWTDIAEYLTMLRKGQQRWQLLNETQYDRHRREGISNSVLETWNISIDYIKQDNNLAYKILHILAYLDNQNIQWEVVQRAAAYADDKRNERAPQDASLIKRAVKRLSDFSFLAKRKEAKKQISFEMHKLVQEGVRYRLSQKSRSSWQDTMTAISPSLSQYQSQGEERTEREDPGENCCSYAALQVVDSLFPNNGLPDVDMWSQCENYLAHAMRVTDFADILDSKVQAAHLLWRVLDYLYDRARYKDMQAIGEKVLAWLQVELGEAHLNTAITMYYIGLSFFEQGRYNEAEELLLKVLNLFHDASEESHTFALHCRATLASTYAYLDRHEDAKTLKEQVLALRRQALGEMHTDTIDSAASLAVTYRDLGDYENSVSLGLQVLEWRRQLYGEMHPATVDSYATLAGIHQREGRYQEAEAMRIKVLAQRERLLGELHPKTLSAATDLADFYYFQENYKTAEDIYAHTLEKQKKVLGDTHPYTLGVKHDLSMVWYRLDYTGNAMKLMEECLHQRIEVLGLKHSATRRSCGRLGEMRKVHGEKL